MTYRRVSGVIFVIIAFAHVIRAAMAVPVQLGNQSIGLGVSWIGAIVAAALAFWAFRGQ